MRLWPFAFANLRMQEPVANSGAQLVAVVTRNERDHHVEPCDASRARNTVDANLK